MDCGTIYRNIDFERKTIHIRQSKYKKDRIVPLSVYMAKGLNHYLSVEHPHIWLFNGKEPDGRYSAKGLSWVMREALKKTSITKDVSLHSLLRHPSTGGKCEHRHHQGAAGPCRHFHYDGLPARCTVPSHFGTQPTRHILLRSIMERPSFEVAQVIDRFGRRFVQECSPSTFTIRTLDALTMCLLNSMWFYGNLLFTCVWETLRTFGYSHYGVETGAICVLHSWGQRLSLHPHIHCIVPAAGITLDERLKPITKDGNFLYPVEQLSRAFRGKILEKVKRMLRKNGNLKSYQSMLDRLWKKDWVVYCEPSMGNVQQIVGYLGRYSHRVAIDNRRLLDIDDSGVTFSYKDGNRTKVMRLFGIEFLRRFALHILPYRFVKIRYYGILGSTTKVYKENELPFNRCRTTGDSRSALRTA
jgi:hypothetical protein